MANIVAIRNGIMANLDTIDGLRVRSTVPDQVEPPMVAVAPRTPDFVVQESMDNVATPGIWRLPFQLFVIASRADVRTAQDTLDGYLSTTGDDSLMRALYTDRKLDGEADNVLWEGVQDYALNGVINGIPYAVANIHITVRSR